MKVQIRSLATEADERETEQAVAIKVIDRHGRTASVLLRHGQQAEVRVEPGIGAVLEAVSIAEPDPHAVVLGDEVTVGDGLG